VEVDTAEGCVGGRPFEDHTIQSEMFCVIAHWNGTRSRVLFREGGAVGVDSLFEARVPFSRSSSLKSARLLFE
jgi:hypothetical protein